MSIGLSIDLQKTTQEIVEFIQKKVYQTGFFRLIIGLSGGIDSAVSCALAVKALRIENIYIGLFPYGKLNKEGLEDARLVIDKLDIPSANVHLIDIKPMVDIIYSSSEHQRIEKFSKDSSRQARTISMDSLRKGNIMARVRMLLLFDLAKKHNCLVLGTENKTEHLLGYFTRFGDQASDIEPIRHLYKTQIRQLAVYLKIPEKIINNIPTAGLWMGQTDEGEFGFSYEEADKILHLYVDLKKNKEEITKLGFAKNIIERVVRRLENNDFKHKLPYILP